MIANQRKRLAIFFWLGGKWDKLLDEEHDYSLHFASGAWRALTLVSGPDDGCNPCLDGANSEPQNGPTWSDCWVRPGDAQNVLIYIIR